MSEENAVANSNVGIEKRVIATLIEAYYITGLDVDCFTDPTTREAFSIIEREQEPVKIQVALSEDPKMVEWVNDLPPALPEAGEAIKVLRQLAKKRADMDLIAEFADDPTELVMRLQANCGDNETENAMTMFTKEDWKRTISQNPMRTHFPNMNRCFQVVQGELITITGENSSCKTQMGMNLHRDFASQGHKSMYISLEMKKQALEIRLQNMFIGKPISDIRINNQFQIDGEFMRSGIQPAITNTLKNMYFYTRSPFFQDIVGAINALRPEVVIIDYFQLMTSRMSKNENEDQRYMAIALRSLASLCPIIVLSQFRKKQGDQERTMDDMYGSVALPQSSSVSIFIKRKNPTASIFDDSITYDIVKNRTFSNRAFDVGISMGIDGMFVER